MKRFLGYSAGLPGGLVVLVALNWICEGRGPLLGRPASAALVRSAACRDPLINQVYNDDIRRAPNGLGDIGECNALNYGGGQWSTYEDLRKKVRLYGATVPPSSCRDQALTEALIELASPPSRPGTVSATLNRIRPRGTAELGECNMYLYGGGSWAGKDDLKDKIRKAKSALSRYGYVVSPVGKLLDSSLRQIGPVQVGPATAIPILVQENGIDTVKVIAADGQRLNSTYIAAATPQQRAQFTIRSLDNGSYLAVPLGR
ncbi:hypothetical protein [Armatimonas sp.]|uniref:hypothetical protein n=1 Tax=Armatimonas sp. TaxID=1872638 RepID=UPI00374DF747